MNPYRRQIEAALRAVTVTSATSYRWFGRRSRPLPRALTSVLAHATAREILIDGLQAVLYEWFYTQGRPVPVSLGGAPRRGDQAFVDALSRANAGAGGWQPGWRVERVANGTAHVVRHGLRVRVPVSHCRGTGEFVSVRRPKESVAVAPGFYMALGDLEPGAAGDGIEERVYFNVGSDGAASLVAGCTRQLNDAAIPFDLKVIDDPSSRRCDVAVLYLDRGGFGRARDLLRMIVAMVGASLYGDAPAFAQPLAPGVAIGEHSADLGASFGTSRCRLLAEGIVDGHEQGARLLGDRFQAVADRFAERGLDIEAPYLSPGSGVRYEL